MEISGHFPPLSSQLQNGCTTHLLVFLVPDVFLWVFYCWTKAHLHHTVMDGIIQISLFHQLLELCLNHWLRYTRHVRQPEVNTQYTDFNTETQGSLKETFCPRFNLQQPK